MRDTIIGLVLAIGVPIAICIAAWIHLSPILFPPTFTPEKIDHNSICVDQTLLPAIIHYYRENRSIPEDLDTLVPGYIPSIGPPQPEDASWTFWSEDETSFGIGFSLDSGSSSSKIVSFESDGAIQHTGWRRSDS